MRTLRNILTALTWTRRSTYSYLAAMEAMDAVLDARLAR